MTSPMTDPTDSPTSEKWKVTRRDFAYWVHQGTWRRSTAIRIGPVTMSGERAAVAVCDALESANAALRAELEAAQKKAALADEARGVISGDAVRGTGLSDHQRFSTMLNKLEVEWLARYDALERESGGTP